MDATITLTYQERLDVLRERKLVQTREKQQVVGSMNHDDWALVLPPPGRRKVVQAISGSGEKITDVIFSGLEMASNHPNGGFYGPRISGENFKRLLDAHPPFVDPMCSLAGAVMSNFNSYRKHGWKPEFDFSHLQPEQKLYQLNTGIGGGQHFTPDLAIGFKLGWRGVLENIDLYRAVHGPDAAGFYDGLVAVVDGIQGWIQRHAGAAAVMAVNEPQPDLRQNLLEVAATNQRLVTEPPETFREACQWMLWYLMAARMYNGSGALGRLDVLLTPFYAREVAAGALSEEEAVFHIACLLLRDTAYVQVGGPDADGIDVTNRVSYLVLEAIDCLRVPSNVGVAVGEGVDTGLLRRGLEIQLERKMGFPKFLGIDHSVSGFSRNGYPAELGRERAYSGCHWSAIPGREYTMNDMVKINFATIFDVALREMVGDPTATPTTAELWSRFVHHLHRAVEVIAEGMAIHLEHMHAIFPELVLDLLCYGPIERGLDATHGGVEFYNLCIDGAGLATAADSFAAVEQRIDREQRLSWQQLLQRLDSDWAGPEGERARLMMKSIPRYGGGDTAADGWAVRIAQTFTLLAKEQPTEGFIMVPGLFSWAANIRMGRILGATPNGRHAGEKISFGSNPDPGFRGDGAPTALAVAVAAVQPGFGNAAPMQMDMDPGLVRDQEAIDTLVALVRGHFGLGGTQINLNLMDKEKILEAHKDPSKYPDLIVRVTGFSAYFASLSPEYRQMVVDRIIAEG